MGVRQRLEPYTNLNKLRALDHEERKQLSMDLRDMLTSWRYLAMAGLAGLFGTAAGIGALIGVLLHHGR